MNLGRRSNSRLATGCQRCCAPGHNPQNSIRPATIAMSYLNIGTELERMGKQKEVIDYLEQTKDKLFRASKYIMIITNAYFAKSYTCAGRKAKFDRAIGALV